MKALVEAGTVVAAGITALINLIIIFARAKVDPSALAVIETMAKDTAKTFRKQTSKIDSLNTGVVTEMQNLTRAVGQMSGNLEGLTRK